VSPRACWRGVELGSLARGRRVVDLRGDELFTTSAAYDVARYVGAASRSSRPGRDRLRQNLRASEGVRTMTPRNAA
jgi:hypothetical protein